MRFLSRLGSLKEGFAGPPARRAAFYSLSQAAYSCLAGSFEMPMAFRLVGRIDLVALVYAFYYSTIFAGFVLGMTLVREGRASFVYRLSLSLLSCLSLGSVLLFSQLKGLGALSCYFLVRGLADGLYWSARHRALLWAVRDSGRDSFALRLQSLVVSLSVLLPLLGGFAITYIGPSLAPASSLGPASAQGLPSGYIPVFLLTGLVTILALLLSPRLQIGRSPLSFSSALSIFRLEGSASWRSYILLIAFAGSLVTIAGGIQTFGVLKTEPRIGALSAGIALLSAIAFLFLSKILAGRRGARTAGILVGALADFFSRLAYAIFPGASGLAAKSLLDALAVPLKSLFGENVQFALIERFSQPAIKASLVTGPAASTRISASAAELYLFREFLIWVARLCACAATGLLLRFLLLLPGSGSQAPWLCGRALLALAAPVALGEFFFLRSFSRANDKPGRDTGGR